VDFWLVLPESGFQGAQDLKVIELDLDDCGAFGEISPNVVYAHLQPSDLASLALRSDHHCLPAVHSMPNNVSLGSSRE
jgi:hypothetical protein